MIKENKDIVISYDYKNMRNLKTVCHTEEECIKVLTKIFIEEVSDELNIDMFLRKVYIKNLSMYGVRRVYNYIIRNVRDYYLGKEEK